MHIFIYTNYVEDFTRDGAEKRFPLIYFWLKDYYYQRAPENFDRTSWSYSDNPGLICDDYELQEKLRETPPDVIGLSLYMWNVTTLLANALWIKENINPNVVIIAAGPNADSRQPFMEEYSFVNYFLPGPGAESFRRLIDKLVDSEDPSEVGGLCYLKDGKVVRNPPVPRKEDPLVLDYMNNFYDEVIMLLDEYTAKHPKVIVLTMFIQGCPYSCSFCEQGTDLWTKINKRDINKLYREIDIIANYPQVILEFADANFGIVPQYEHIIDYVIENGKGNVSLKKPPFAKNNVDHTFHLLKKMRDAGIYYSPFDGQISLQDPNPEILKLNGRPISKEYEKIKAFREYTGSQEHKLAQVEIILGMPYQTWDTLWNSMTDLMSQDLLSHFLPYLYMIFPNTEITKPGSTINVTHRRMAVRGERNWVTGYVDKLDAKSEMDYDFVVSTDTLTCEELVAVHYYWVLFCHIYGFLGWLRTPLNYLYNHHDITFSEFIKSFTGQFHPSRWKDLPMNIRFDLQMKARWFRGEDKLFQRLTNDGRYWVSVRRVSQYRFHANYEEFETLLWRTFEELGVTADERIKDMMQWQGSRLNHWDDEVHKSQYKNSIISHNWDDVSMAKQDVYYKSRFTFQYPENVDIYDELEKIADIEWIPNTHHEEIHPSMQEELNIHQQKPLDYYKELDNKQKIS